MSFREFDFPPRRSFRIYLYLQFTIGARGNTILARSSLGFCTHDYAPGARAPAEAPARAHTTVAFGNPGILWPWFEWIYVSDHLITHLHTILAHARRPVVPRPRFFVAHASSGPFGCSAACWRGRWRCAVLSSSRRLPSTSKPTMCRLCPLHGGETRRSSAGASMNSR